MSIFYFFIPFLSLILTGCSSNYKPLTTEQMTAINSDSLKKLAAAKENMEKLKIMINAGRNDPKTNHDYVRARCDFLRESEYLYSTHARIPCDVKTISLNESEGDYINRANSMATKNFKDPESAKFRNTFLSSTDVPMVCGEVNGKNSYGAYTGYKRYYATDTENFSGIDDGSSEFMFIWDNYCKK